MRKVFAVAIGLVLAGCVSSQMKSFVGQDASELQMTYGPPESVVDLPNGRRAFMHRWGGGTRIVPAQSVSTVTPTYSGATVATSATPAMALTDQGCLLAFIAEPREDRWVVVDYRVPKDLVC